MHARHLEIALIGAGLAGLTAARALQLQGYSVRVYEQAEALAEVGAALTITPNATHVLNAVGLAPTFMRGSSRQCAHTIRRRCSSAGASSLCAIMGGG